MTDISTLAPKIQTFFNQTANQVETGHDLDVTITKQGLQTRITDAVPFLKEMFQQGLLLFRNTLPLDLKLLQQFTAIFITDGSTVALPDVLKDEFPGCGGDGPDAVVKLQLTFEFLRGVIAGITCQSGRSPDQAYAGDLQSILPGSLHLTDLGYFVLARFRAIDEQKAYFLSRFDTETALFDAATGEPLDLLPWFVNFHPQCAGCFHPLWAGQFECQRMNLLLKSELGSMGHFESVCVVASVTSLSSCSRPRVR